MAYLYGGGSKPTERDHTTWFFKVARYPIISQSKQTYTSLLYKKIINLYSSAYDSRKSYKSNNNIQQLHQNADRREFTKRVNRRSFIKRTLSVALGRFHETLQFSVFKNTNKSYQKTISHILYLVGDYKLLNL